MSDAAARLARVPGVERVALTTMTPMYGVSFLELFLPGRATLPRLPRGAPSYTGVSPTYFAAMGIHVRQGRGLDVGDRAGSPRVLVVNETMARTYWPSGDVLGQCVHITSRTSPCYTVVGVVEDAHRTRIVEPPTMQYYVPLTQPPADGYGASTVVLRTPPARAATVAAAARRELRDRVPEGEPRVQPMAELLAPWWLAWSPAPDLPSRSAASSLTD